MKTYAYGTSKDLVSENKDIECNSIIKQYKMINFGDVTSGSIKEHKANWPQVPDHSCRILIIGGSGFGRANSLFILKSHLADINKIYLYAKYLYKAKYQLLINKRESIGLKHLSDSKVFIGYSNDMDDIFKNIEK